MKMCVCLCQTPKVNGDLNVYSININHMAQHSVGFSYAFLVPY